MLKRTAFIFIIVTLCLQLTAYAAAAGFEEDGGITSTKNEYFFETYETYLVQNNELISDPDYEEIFPGSDIYIPVYVYPNRGKNPIIATDKMIKDDKVTVSGKVMAGSQYVGDITLADGKKLKNTGLPAGIYARVPFNGDYDKLSKSTVTVRLVLSVNGISYQDTRVTLTCYLINRIEDIYDNSVYGAKIPTQFTVSGNYSGEATFDFGDNIKYTARVKNKAKYYLNLSRTPSDAITAMYPDAYLDFYNFLGAQKTFESTGRLEIPVQRDKLAKKGEQAALYVYQIDGDTLVSLDSPDVSFSSATNKLLIRTKTLGKYLISNQALMRTLNDDPDNDILKSGYAAISSSEISSSAPPPSPSSSASSKTASSAASVVSSSQPEDQYVPEEAPSNPNENVSTGLPINAANKSADNPSTADPAVLFTAFIGILSGGILMIGNKMLPGVIPRD